MNKVTPIALFTLMFALMQVSGYAQKGSRFKKHRYTSIGGSINAMNYVGEVDPGPSFISPGIKFTRPNIAVTYLRRMTPRTSVRGSVSWGRIKGSDWDNASFNDKDIHRKFRNLSFRSDIIEVKADVIIDLWENRGRYTKRPDYTPYFFTGIAYFHMNPKTQYKGNWTEIEPLELEGKSFSLHQVALPIGLGFRYKLSKQWDLAFEMGWRFTLTDYMDGVSKYYVDKSTFNGNQTAIDLSDRSGELIGAKGKEEIAPYIAKQGYSINAYSSSGYNINGYGGISNGVPDQRGDKNRDWYIVTGFHLTYIIPGRIICPKFRSFDESFQKKLLASY